MKRHVEGQLQDHDAHEHELVSEVDRSLGDAYIGCKTARQGAGQVHPVQLEDKQANEQQWQHRGVDSKKSLSSARVVFFLCNASLSWAIIIVLPECLCLIFRVPFWCVGRRRGRRILCRRANLVAELLARLPAHHDNWDLPNSKLS